MEPSTAWTIAVTLAIIVAIVGYVWYYKDNRPRLHIKKRNSKTGRYEH